MTFREVARIAYNENCRCAGCEEALSDFGKPYQDNWHWDCAKDKYDYKLGIDFIMTNELETEFVEWLPREICAATWFDFVGLLHMEAKFNNSSKLRVYLRDFCLEDMNAFIKYLGV